MVEDEIRNLAMLVDMVEKRIEREVKEGKLETLHDILWNVPTNLLLRYVTEEKLKNGNNSVNHNNRV